MHEIESLPPDVRALIRAETVNRFRERAKSEKHDEIKTDRILLAVAERLAERNFIQRPGLGRNEEYTALHSHYLTDGFPNYGIPGEFANLVRTTVWELFMQGVLAPGPHVREGSSQLVFHYDLNRCMITPYGVRVLLSTDELIQVYDPDGYLNLFYTANPSPDPEMMRYLAEGISVLRANHLFASVVLLGIASERLIEVLAQALRGALGVTRGTTWYQNSFLAKREISARFSTLTNTLLTEYGAELGRENLTEAIKGVVTLTFEVIRKTRNEIAHPKGQAIMVNEVVGMYHNFVQYFKHINKTLFVLSNNPRSS